MAPAPDRPRRTRGTTLQALQVVGLSAIAALGLALVVEGLGASDPYLTAFGAFMAAIGLLGVVSVAADVRTGRRRPGLVLGATADGEPATIAPRSRTGSLLPALGVAAVALPLLVAGGAALLDAAWVLGVLLLVAGGYLALRLLPFVRGRVDPGGVWLSATGVTHVRDGSSWRVRWEDVQEVRAGSTVGLVLAGGAAVVRDQSGPWGRRSLGPASDRLLTVDDRQLGVEGEVLAFLLAAYLLDPDLRHQLGRPESLGWEILREPTGRSR